MHGFRTERSLYTFSGLLEYMLAIAVTCRMWLLFRRLHYLHTYIHVALRPWYGMVWYGMVLFQVMASVIIIG